MISAVLLVAANIAWRVYANWGLITVNVSEEPLSKVISSIARQGHITLNTNIDPTTKVTMRVEKVPLVEALETLAALTESEWRLGFVIAPDKSSIKQSISGFVAGERPTDWKRLYYPMPQLFSQDDAEELPIDPRRDLWNVKAPPESTLQAYLENAARSVNVWFTFPEQWNPEVKKGPSSGEVHSIIPKLVKSAGGTYEEMFMLSKRDWRGGRDGRPDGGAPNADRQSRGERSPEERQKMFASMQARVEAEIEKLPTDQQAAAREQADKSRQFWQSVQNLPEAERREKMREFFSDSTMQANFEERSAARDSRKSPEQRNARYKQYVERKGAAK